VDRFGKDVITMKHPLRLFSLAIVSILLLAVRSLAMDTGEYFTDPSAVVLANAAADGDTKAIDRALANGASPNAAGKDGMTPVIWALINQSPDGFKYLVAHGGNPNLSLSDGRSAMSLAAMHEKPEYLRAALDHGGDPNLPNSQDNGFTPIYYAILALRTENVGLLIKGGANLNWKSSSGETPLMLAAVTNRYDLVFEMLQAGADPTVTNTHGRTILTIIRRIRTDPASEMGSWRTKVINLLQEKGLDVENGQ